MIMSLSLIIIIAHYHCYYHCYHCSLLLFQNDKIVLNINNRKDCSKKNCSITWGEKKKTKKNYLKKY